MIYDGNRKGKEAARLLIRLNVGNDGWVVGCEDDPFVSGVALTLLHTYLERGRGVLAPAPAVGH